MSKSELPTTPARPPRLPEPPLLSADEEIARARAARAARCNAIPVVGLN